MTSVVRDDERLVDERAHEIEHIDRFDPIVSNHRLRRIKIESPEKIDNLRTVARSSSVRRS